MKYFHNKKCHEVSERDIFFLASHTAKKSGVNQIDNLAIETAENGIYSIGVLNTEVYGAGAILINLNDILLACGNDLMTMWLKDGDRLEDVPISKLALKAFVQQYGNEQAV